MQSLAEKWIIFFLLLVNNHWQLLFFFDTVKEIKTGKLIFSLILDEIAGLSVSNQTTSIM